MSVGVCIINRNGIALAADSAGTFTGNKMFYNSMNKVFALSKEKPYGAITYGSTAIYNVGIEQILKEFTIYLADKDVLDFYEIETLFVDFIKEKQEYYRFDGEENLLCSSLIKELVVDWGNKIKSIINEEDSKQKINDILEALKKHIDESLRIENFDVSEYVHKKYASIFDLILGVVVPELRDYAEEKEFFWDLISQYFNLSLQIETSNSMGLFFAGYGQNDAFPKFIHLDIYTVINGQLKYRIKDKFDESNNGAKIVSLAQGDVIMTFCKGISEYFINYIPQKVDEVITRKINSLQPECTQEQMQKVKANINGCGKEIYDIIQSVSQEKNINPLLASVQLIPIPEMAMLAENLINITSLKRTFSLDGNQQTVGGPTDVAIITKPDGFSWIKKKQLNKD